MPDVYISVRCIVVSQFESQINTVRGKICIGFGVMITPIAEHFGIQITETMISTDILLNKTCLCQ